MGATLDFLDAHAGGVFILIFLVATLAVVVLGGIQWFSWIRCYGRYVADNERDTRIGPSGAQSGRLFTAFLTGIISEFRHLLALLIFLMFAFVLGFVVYEASYVRVTKGGASVMDIETMTRAVQVVVASLGGLVGSIIGYYFGESSVIRNVKESTSKPPVSSPAPAPTQAEPPGPAPTVSPLTSDVRPADAPPGL